MYTVGEHWAYGADLVSNLLWRAAWPVEQNHQEKACSRRGMKQQRPEWLQGLKGAGHSLTPLVGPRQPPGVSKTQKLSFKYELHDKKLPRTTNTEMEVFLGHRGCKDPGAAGSVVYLKRCFHRTF